MKNFQRRCLALLLTGVMIFSAGGAAFAADIPDSKPPDIPNLKIEADDSSQSSPQQPPCPTVGCTLLVGHEGDCQFETGLEESDPSQGQEQGCALTEGCILPAGHEGECRTEEAPACICEPVMEESGVHTDPACPFFSVCTAMVSCTLPDGHEGDCQLPPPADQVLMTRQTVGNLEYELDEESLTAVVIGGTPTRGQLVILATVEAEGSTYRVTAIADRAFEGMTDSVSLTLPEGLERIGEGAFSMVPIQGTLQIPDSVTQLGARAFEGGSYQQIIIGDGLREIPANAFAYYSGSGDTRTIIRVILGSSMEHIEPTAFSGTEVTKLVVYSESEQLGDEIRSDDVLGWASLYFAGSVKRSADLQAQIDTVAEGETATIEISENYCIDETITIPAGKTITLYDQSGRTFTAVAEQIFEVSGTLILDSAKSDMLAANYYGAISTNPYQGSVAHVLDGGTLILKNGTFRGGTINGNYSGAVRVENGGTFQMEGGYIRDSQITNSTLTGAVSIDGGGSFQMSGGYIRNNRNSSTSAYSAGGVLLVGWSADSPYASMTLSGDAVIDDNSSAENGGGIHLIGNAKLEMSGGTIQRNRARGGAG